MLIAPERLRYTASRGSVQGAGSRRGRPPRLCARAIGRGRCDRLAPLHQAVRLDESELILADFGWLLWAQAEGGGQGSPLGMLPVLVLIGVMFYFLLLRPQRQRDAAHKALLQNLKKNDRVVTIGGIYGVVVNVQREQDEVTIKVDENTNTKLRVTFSSIARVVSADEPNEKTEKT